MPSNNGFPKRILLLADTITRAFNFSFPEKLIMMRAKEVALSREVEVVLKSLPILKIFCLLAREKIRNIAYLVPMQALDEVRKRKAEYIWRWRNYPGNQRTGKENRREMQVRVMVCTIKYVCSVSIC